MATVTIADVSYEVDPQVMHTFIRMSENLKKCRETVKEFLDCCDYGSWNNLEETYFRPKLEKILKGVK